MEVVQDKYNNFKQFLREVPGIDGTYLYILNQVTLEQFLTKITLDKHLSENEILKQVAITAQLNLNNIPEETKIKFKRYIKYFKEVSSI